MSASVAGPGIGFLALAFRLARRELRGGVKGLTTVVLCLALGVGVIASVGVLRAAVDAGLNADGRRILGGDVAVDGGSASPPDAIRDWLVDQGGTVTEVVLMRSLLVTGTGERSLIELKAVDAAWPLAGAAETLPPKPLQTALAPIDGRFGLLADRLLLDRFGLHPGDVVRLGSASFRVEGALTAEPDRVATPSIFGPRVLISAEGLKETGLIAPGTLARHEVRATLPPALAASAPDRLRARFQDLGLRVRGPKDAAPSVRSFLDQTSLFLTLVGLTALLMGGIGAANGVGAWLDARAPTIATLRCLGASSGLVFAVCLIQVLALSGIGIAGGLALGAAVPFLAAALPPDILPVPPAAGFYPVPLAIAFSFGLLTALCFSLWPLGRAARIPGAALFRGMIQPEWTWPAPAVMGANAAVAGALLAVTILSAEDQRFAVWFCLGSLGAVALFRLAAWIVMRLAAAAPTSRRTWVRLGVSALHRPGAATPLLMVSLGLGLSTLATVALTQNTIRGLILEQLPSQAPSFFFVDIQNEQMDRFRALATSVPGVTEIRDVPSLRARVVAIKGVPVERAEVSPDTAFALKGDRGLTYAAEPPEQTRLTAGAWWPADYNGPPLVSLDAGMAKGWHVGVGDVIRVNVLGRDIDLTIASLRDIAWRSLSINFFMVASPGLLSHAPHTHIATVRVDPAHEAALLRTVTDGLPNVTGIRVAEALAALSGLLDQVANALAATGALTLIAGLLVLTSAVSAGQKRRIRDSIILRTLGATGRQIRAAWLVEFGLLGLAAGLVSMLVAAGASYGITRGVLHTPWLFSWRVLLGTLSGALAIMLLFGHFGLTAAAKVRPLQLLRNE